MADIKQSKRLLTIETPLGKDVLLLESCQGREAVSGLFQFSLHMLSKKSSVAFGSIVGKAVTVTIETETGKRTIHGFVNQFAQGSRFVHTSVEQGQEYYTRYHASIVPWLWNLTRTSDCRIFQNKSVPDIVQQIFKDLGYTDFKLKLSGSYPPRTYCVQYRESDFDFVSRLLEEEGIFYFFEHSASKHTLVLGDSTAAFQDCPGQASAHYNPKSGEKGEDSISNWVLQQAVRTAKYAVADYNFETPSTDLKVNAPTTLTVGKNDKLEVYDYEGRYQKRADGERRVKTRMEELESAHTQINGASSCLAFTAGYAFNLLDHYRPEYNEAYVLTGVSHNARSNLLSDDSASSYTNTFDCIPKQVRFRPARVTPKPIVRGTQTGVVVGKSGEEIWTDKYGRIKVQFHWDREGKKDENSSCWVRVATPWAGKQWGAISIPRIGQEVVIDFLEGDPDQPLVIGSVYNAEQMPPYALPDNQTQSGLKSRSSKQGSPDNFNELRFEDKKGSEDIYFHAEKDFHRLVENDDDLKVERDQTIEVKRHRTEIVKEGNEQVTIDKGNRTVVVSKGNDLHQLKMGNRDVKIDMGNDTLTIKLGNQTTKLNLGKSATEAMQSIELKVGQSSIKIDQMGITVKGMMVKIEGQIQTEVKGLMTKIGGDAMLQAKGGITMIG